MVYSITFELILQLDRVMVLHIFGLQDMKLQ